MTGQVIILCGMIASGKTTYANKLKAQGNTVVLSVDDLMLTLFDGCLGPKHDQTAARCIKFLCRQAVDLAKLGINVVLDYGFWLAQERQMALSYFEKEGIPARLYYLKTPEQVRIQRLIARNEKLKGSKERVYIIDESLRTKLDAKFQPPDEGEIYKIIEV